MLVTVRVHGGEVKVHLSSLLSVLNTTPSLSADRAVRIVSAARLQQKAVDGGSPYTPGVKIARGSCCSVMFVDKVS